MNIDLPALHFGQKKIIETRGRFNAVRCGRRFGKTKLLISIAANVAANGLKAGVFAPEHKQIVEPFDEALSILRPVIRRSSKGAGEIRTQNGGVIDFWHLNDNLLAGRGREYDVVLIDEAAYAKHGQMIGTWERAIKPTLLTRRGKAWIFSTPNGINDEDFFWAICNDASYGFTQHHAPTSASPYIPADELALEKTRTHPLVYRQEYEAEFVDFSGEAFFSLEKLTENGAGVPCPRGCDYVFAVVDSALKDGSGNDGTAVVYFAISKYVGIPLTILDWDIVQINSDLLPVWLPGVFKRLEELAGETKARMGSVGVFIEDKASGITLNQYSKRVGWPTHPIAGAITSIGKDGRAISCSGAVWRGEVKLSALAFGKTSVYKGQTRNHLLAQVIGYRVGDKDAARRADDLADCFMYGIIIGLGGPDGF